MPSTLLFSLPLDCHRHSRDFPSFSSNADCVHVECSSSRLHLLQRSGRYPLAADSFTEAIAVVPDGQRSREGGSYAVWLAQVRRCSLISHPAINILNPRVSLALWACFICSLLFSDGAGLS